MADDLPISGDGSAGDVGRAILAAMAEDVVMLASLHDKEASPAYIERLKARAFPESLLLPPAVSLMRTGVTVLGQALARLKAPVGTAELDELAADYAAIYLTHAYQASPCESVWTDPEGLALQESTFRLRSRYRSHGLAVENWRQRPEDHLVVQLHFIALMLDRVGPAVAKEVASFLDEHLLRWLPLFASRVAARCATRFYAGAALLTAGYCDQMRDVLAEMLGEPRPEPAPLPTAAHSPETAPEDRPGYVPGAGPSW